MSGTLHRITEPIDGKWFVTVNGKTLSRRSYPCLLGFMCGEIDTVERDPYISITFRFGNHMYQFFTTC